MATTSMNILGFDTATHACTVALQTDGGVFTRHEIAPQQHAKLLLPMIHAVISDAKIALADIHAIAFGNGPGSFMGVRLATATAQGLAFGLSIPIIPISTLQILAQTYCDKTACAKVVAGWDARMQEVYFGKYECDTNHIMQPVQSDEIGVFEKIDTDKLTALGFSFAGNIFSDDTYPESASMLKIAEKKYQNNEAILPENAHPHYVRHVVFNHK